MELSTFALTASASSGTIKWYDAASGGTEITDLNPTINSTTTYYAEAYSSCGMSLRISVTVGIDTPSVPTLVFVSPDTVNCGNSADLNASSVYRILWYDSDSSLWNNICQSYLFLRINPTNKN